MAETRGPEIVLVGRRVRLRPINPGDYDLLRQLELSPHLAHRWRNRGTTPGMADWIRRMEQAVLAQFLIVDTRDGGEEWVGLVSVYNPAFEHGYAYLAVARLGDADRSTRTIEGTVLFLDYVFTTWAFRKLYVETPAFNVDQFQSGVGRLLAEEGRLDAHWYFDGRYWDHVMLSITRERWDERGPGLLRTARGPAAEQAR